MRDKGRAVLVKKRCGADEIYTEFYECPKCKNDMLMSSFSFCPTCGVALEWPSVPQLLPLRRKSALGKIREG